MSHFLNGGVLQKILRNHPDEPRNHGFHLELAKPLENLPSQFGTLFVPTFRQRTAPRRHIVHKKPSEIGRTRHKFVYLVEIFVAITAHQHLFPDTFHPRDDEWQIDAVKCHPVDFLLPAVPVPKRHRIAVGAEVQIVAVIDARMMGFRLDDRQFSGQFSARIVPRNVDACVMLQKPIDACGDGHVVAAFDRNFSAIGRDFESRFFAVKSRSAVHDSVGVLR